MLGSSVDLILAPIASDKLDNNEVDVANEDPSIISASNSVAILKNVDEKDSEKQVVQNIERFT